MSVRGVNKMIVMGRLGVDPELNPNAKIPVGSMSIATPGRMKENEQQVEWVKVTVFGKTAENCKRYLKKGSTVYVEGRQQTDKYEGKDGITRYSTKCIAEKVVFVGSDDRGKGASNGTEDNRDTRQVEGSYEFEDYSPAPF